MSWIRFSCVRQGVLNRDAASESYSVEWVWDVDLSSGHGEEGRGMELSELILWNDRMYTMDDRSGIVYEIVDFRTESARVVPRFILMEGDGNTEKGLKGEWAAVKDNKLIISSFGKEYANSDGTIRNWNNNWVAEITADGQYVRLCVRQTSQPYRASSCLLTASRTWIGRTCTTACGSMLVTSTPLTSCTRLACGAKSAGSGYFFRVVCARPRMMRCVRGRG
jgi:Apyrase